MIKLSNLENFLSQYISILNNPSIIYIGGGTYCYSTNSDEKKNWNYEENQQFPPFLHDLKAKHQNIKILIVLIDPAFNLNTPPYIVNSTDQFYSESWKKSNKYENLFHSTLGIDVITIQDTIIWNKSNNNIEKEEEDTFDFENFMVNLSNKVSISNSNTLMFYHEFTGSNVSELEQVVKKKSTFNSNKICIDITRGSNMSCYFNLSNPEFYPVILLDETTNKLKYINPDILSNNEKINIISQYKKFTKNFEISDSNCDYYKFKPNYLLATNPKIILCFQIIKSDKIIFNTILNGLIPMIRYLFICENNTNINNKIWGISHLIYLKYYINNLNCDYETEKYIFNQIEQIEEYINIVESINLNISSNPNYDEIILNLKENIINGLFDIIKNILANILVKYNININIIDDLIINLKQISNKYEMTTCYKNFILNLNI